MDSKESIPSKKREIIKDLLALSGKSASGIAKQAGLNRSNVTKWLKHGGSDVGEEAQDRMVTILGGAGGTLRKDIVHVWHWKLNELDLGPLVRTLEWAGGDWEMITIAPIGRNVTEWTFPLPIAIYDRNLPVRIYLGAIVSPLIRGVDISLLGPHILPPGKARWRPRSRYQAVHPSGQLETLSIEEKIYDEWAKGIISVADYDRILWGPEKKKGNATPKIPMSWESFGKILEQSGIKQSDILEKFPEIKNPTGE
jgi:hypothetical protein